MRRKMVSLRRYRERAPRVSKKRVNENEDTNSLKKKRATPPGPRIVSVRELQSKPTNSRIDNKDSGEESATLSALLNYMRDKNLDVEDIKRKYASSGNQIVDLEYAMYFVLLRTNTCSLNGLYTQSLLQRCSQPTNPSKLSPVHRSLRQA